MVVVGGATRVGSHVILEWLYYCYASLLRIVV